VRGSIAQQVQKIHDSDRLKNRAAIKCLLHCTHFLAHQHIAHTTNFSDLVDLVVSCGGENLKYFIEKAGKNAAYTSKDAVIDFVETIGQWVEEKLLKRLHQVEYFSLLADECTDIVIWSDKIGLIAYLKYHRYKELNVHCVGAHQWLKPLVPHFKIP